MRKKISERMQDGFFLAIIAAICGGSVPVAAKIALEVFQPFTVVSIRFFFATLFLLPFVYKSREISWKYFKGFFKGGLIGAMNPILLFIALPFTKASVSPLIYACVPALIALYMFVIQKKTISQKQVLGIIIGFIGVALIILLPVIQEGNDLAAMAGNILIFGGAIGFMFYGLISKKQQQEMNATPIALTFYFSLITLLVSIPFTIRELMMINLSAPIGIEHVFSGVYVGVVGTGVLYIVYQYALKLGSEIAATLFTYLQPIVTILLASLFLGEKITLPFVIGGVLAVVGARIAARK